jgi:hypothetical protein
MFLLDGVWVASATDLVSALRCEYQLLARRAEKAGLVAPLDTEDRPAHGARRRLGDEHEDRTLERLQAEHGTGPDGVVSIEQPSTKSRAELEAAHAADARRHGRGCPHRVPGRVLRRHFHGSGRLPGAGRPPRWAAAAPTPTSRPTPSSPATPRSRRCCSWRRTGSRWSRWATRRPPRCTCGWATAPRAATATRTCAHLRRPHGAPARAARRAGRRARVGHRRAPLVRVVRPLPGRGRRRDDVLLVAGMRVEQRRKLVAAGITTIE